MMLYIHDGREKELATIILLSSDLKVAFDRLTFYIMRKIYRERDEDVRFRTFGGRKKNSPTDIDVTDFTSYT